MKNRLLWIGSFQSEEGYRNSPINNMGEASAYASQKGIINGIDKALDKGDVMDSVNVVVNPPYPIYPEKYVRGYRWKRNNASEDICVGYHNTKYINYLDREITIKKEIKKWSDGVKKDEQVSVLLYAASVGKLKGALFLKKKCGAKIFVILPDIPDFVNAEAAKPILIAKRIAAKRIRRYFKKIDGFILYSSYMAEYYGLPEGKWMLMEGVFDSEEEKTMEAIKKTRTKDGTIKLMYCGSLDKRRSIPEILEAFSLLKDSEQQHYELWFVGTGNCDELIEDWSKKDLRIKNYGFINSRTEVLKLETKADILLYTREIESKSAYYCFPSKLFEYLMTGNPVACVRVPSISDEFFEYMHPIEKSTAEGIYRSVNEILSRYELFKKRAEEARCFIMKNKSSDAQGKRILNFVFGKEVDFV